MSKKIATRQFDSENRRRITIGFFVVALFLTLLIFRVAWIQIVDADDLTERAIAQQRSDEAIQAKRGNIYDRNGKELATSITCYKLSARPYEIKDNKENVDEIASGLASIIGKDVNEIKEILTQDYPLVTVANYLEKDVADKVRELEYSSLELSEVKKRYYPLGNFASQLLGSVTIDETGRTGIEYQYDQYLSGVAGRWVKETDVSGNILVNGSQKYYDAEDGLNVVLTLDETIQYYCENAIAKGMKNCKPKRIMCVAMDVDTGDILANVISPGFNPNDPGEPDDKERKAEFDKLSGEKQSLYLSQMWRNGIVSDTYEPGSTFKVITCACALEDRAISTTDTFGCGCSINVAGVRLRCWQGIDHGRQTYVEAIGNSCNPALAQIAARLGAKKFYKYIELLGFKSITGIDYPGEVNSLMYDVEDVGPVELATNGYGQGIAVTPIQLITAMSAIGNGGNLMQPRYVKALTNSDGKVVKSFEPTVVRKVLSEDTAKEIQYAMEFDVAESGGGAIAITGYRIGGKTGTADKVEDGAYRGNYYCSFVGMAPMDDPKIAVLVIVDSPTVYKTASQTAGPILKEIFENTFRYMQIEPKYTKEEQAQIDKNYTVVPNVVGEGLGDAVGMLSAKSLDYVSKGTGDNYTVVAQYPKAGEKVTKKTKVYLYDE